MDGGDGRPLICETARLADTRYLHLTIVTCRARLPPRASLPRGYLVLIIGATLCKRALAHAVSTVCDCLEVNRGFHVNYRQARNKENNTRGKRQLTRQRRAKILITERELSKSREM